jgi:hypothetical protein
LKNRFQNFFFGILFSKFCKKVYFFYCNFGVFVGFGRKQHVFGSADDALQTFDDGW